MTSSSIVFAGATAALLLAIAASVRRPGSITFRHPAILGSVALFVTSVVVRTVAVHPTLIHADVVAPELVDCILQFPATCTTRGASYGQYGFLVLGALARPFGNDLNAVFRAMAIVGALDVALLAVLAYRLGGSPYAALLAVAVSGTNPVFMRIAGSEDMHNVGLLLGLVALIAMDVFATTRRTAPLIAATLALCLLVHTRQTFHVFAPCAFLLGVARGGRSVLTSRRFWIGGGVVAAVLLRQIVANAGSQGLMGQMAAILGDPALVPTILRHHAVLDVGRFGVLPVLTVVAVLSACFAGPVARAAAVGFVLTFIATYPCGMPSPGVELAQRLPAVAFGALLVALTGAALLDHVPTGPRVVTALCAAAVLTIVPRLFPGWRILGVSTPIHQEYAAVETAGAALPPAFTLVKGPTAEDAVHGHARYAGLLQRLGKRVRVVQASEFPTAPPPWIFLEDVECWTYSFRELTGDDGPTPRMRAARWDLVLFGRQPSSQRPPDGPRPECQGLLGAGTPVGPRLVIRDPGDDPPFLFYAGSAVPIQFYELRAAADWTGNGRGWYTNRR
jgi:hypothetical protein